MFFPKKKKPESTPDPDSNAKAKPKSKPSSAENRAHYRKRSSKSQRLEAILKVEGWSPLTVELLDLTVRGAGVRVPFANDRNLKRGDIVELSIGAMMRDEIMTPARIANTQADGNSHIRYGLEFLNLGNLYSQLDAFYSRHFNRRRKPRVLPSLDRKISATLTWNGGELNVHVFDVSEAGIGLVLTKDSAARVLEIPRFNVKFKLPGTNEELKGPVTVKHRSPVQQHVLLGLIFDVEAADGFAKHAAALRAFVEQRTREMAMWDSRA
jgi:c-di-GMP-binding flagellar brake protein YcgR